MRSRHFTVVLALVVGVGAGRVAAHETDHLELRSAQVRTSPQRKNRDMVSWVVLSNSYVTLTVDSLRARLDQLYPGQFLPPRDRGNFVIDGTIPGAEFLIQSNIPGAAGLFLLHSVPGPYTDVSGFAEHIKDSALQTLAKSQKAWLSVDLIRQHTSEADAYRLIGSVLAKLVPPDAAVLVHPSRNVAVRFDDDIRRKLANGEQLP